MKSKWSYTFIIIKVFPSGAIEIQDLGDAQTFVVNKQRLKQYVRGDMHIANVSLIILEP